MGRRENVAGAFRDLRVAGRMGPDVWEAQYMRFFQLIALAGALLLKLVERSHVLIEHFRPGTLERIGLGPAALSFVGMAGREAILNVNELITTRGQAWPAEWLNARQLSHAAEAWRRFAQKEGMS